MLRIVYYDISDNRARSRIADCLLEAGFDRIQYSVFIGQIKAEHWLKVWSRVTGFFNDSGEEEDKVFSHIIPPHHFRKMSILGKPPEISWILHDVSNIFF